MDNASDVMDQVEHAALQQIVVLNMATQSIRPRLDADGLPLEESMVLGQMLAGLSHLMLQWVNVLLGGEDEEARRSHCDEVCGSGPEET